MKGKRPPQRTLHDEDHEAPEVEEPRSGYLRTARRISEPPPRTREPWGTIEEFEHEGYAYRLQRRPLPSSRASLLAPREQEILELLSQGVEPREAATILGLAPSTIRVLLHRAASKFRAKSTDELLERFSDEQGS